MLHKRTRGSRLRNKGPAWDFLREIDMVVEDVVDLALTIVAFFGVVGVVGALGT